MRQSVLQKNGFTLINVKVTVRAYIIKMITVMYIPGPSWMNPRPLQDIGGGDNIVSNIPIYAATPSSSKSRIIATLR